MARTKATARRSGCRMVCQMLPGSSCNWPSQALPQGWHILVPTARAEVPIKFLGYFHPPSKKTTIDKVDCWAWKRLARPDLNALNRSNPALQLTPNPQLSCTLTILPSELLSEILTHLDKTSVLALASSCLLLTYRLIPHIDQDVTTCFSWWANEPLACLPAYLQTLPPPFEHGGLALRSVGMERFLGPDNEHNYDGRPGRRKPVAQWYVAKAKDKYAGGAERGIEEWISALTDVERKSKRCTTQPEITTRVLRHFLTPLRICGPTSTSHSPTTDTCQDLSDATMTAVGGMRKRKIRSVIDNDFVQYTNQGTGNPQNIWYLRNLDTKEFVRLVPRVVRTEARQKNQTEFERLSSATTMFNPTEEPHFEVHNSGSDQQNTCLVAAVMHEGSEIMPIEAVLALRTIWSDSTSMVAQPSNRIKSLVAQKTSCWAGHRFDMVTKSMHHDTEGTESSLMQGGIPETTPTMGGNVAAEIHVATSKPYDENNDGSGKVIQHAGWLDVTEQNVELVRICFAERIPRPYKRRAVDSSSLTRSDRYLLRSVRTSPTA